MERVYVANLPPDIRIKDIDDFFRPFGKLVFIDVNHRANPVYAYVQFDNSRNAFNAVKARHGYDYEGYTLQLRLVENEVKKRRDASPPPPPPIFSNSYERQNANGLNNNYVSSRMGGNNSANSSSQWASNNRSDMQQLLQQNIGFSSSNRFNIDQSSIMPYSSGGRPNMDQQFSTANRSNVQQQYSSTSRSGMQQQFSNANRSNMQEQYFNSNRSNMNQQYSNINRSNISQQNNLESRRDMARENMASYSSGRSNMQQQYSNENRLNVPQLQNMDIQHPNDSWNTGQNDMGWNTRNFGNDNFGIDNFGNNKFNNINNNAVPNVNYNTNNDRYANNESYTSGLSGAGCKWFDRFIRQGYSPERARAKALEHRTVPYLRNDSKKKPIPNNQTDMALETIGNTIISLLSTNPAAGNNGPSSSVAPQPQGNPVSKRQYLKSSGILRIIRDKRVKTAKDRISLKYHTQIVKDYEKFNKVGSRSKDEILRKSTSKTTPSKSITAKKSTSERTYKPIISTRTEEQLRELMTKLKAKLIKSAREIASEAGQKGRLGGAYKKRTKLLMEHGFLEMEAKSLAWNHIEKLEELLSIKREYDSAKKTVFIPAAKASLSNGTKSVVYRNDLKYLEEYSKHRIKELSKTILYGLSECIKRIHDYEKGRKLPLTENKFTRLLLKITSREGFFKDLKKTSSRGKKKGQTGTIATTDKKSVKENTEKNKVDSKNSDNKKEVEGKVDDQDDENVTEEMEANEDKQEDDDHQDNEENQDNGDKEDKDNEDGDNKDNEDEENQDNEEYQDNQDIKDKEFDGNEEELEDKNEEGNDEENEEGNGEENEEGNGEENEGGNDENEDEENQNKE